MIKHVKIQLFAKLGVTLKVFFLTELEKIYSKFFNFLTIIHPNLPHLLYCLDIFLPYQASIVRVSDNFIHNKNDLIHGDIASSNFRKI